MTLSYHIEYRGVKGRKEMVAGGGRKGKNRGKKKKMKKHEKSA